VVRRQVAQWRETGFEVPVAVNVSARNFADPGFVDRTLELLEAWKVPPRLLQLELTESALMDDPARRLGQLEQVRASGISIAIDDFGTGYSSLSYLATLPVDTLKIDRSFVSAMLDAPRIRSIVGGTVSLARALSMTTVAEGVETREQAQALIDSGCDQLQGFLFSPGIPAEAFRSWAEGFRLADYGLAPLTANLERAQGW
jgi:EAL domain-containing protein (putative c-di-GMP-specific phosphodiesterase class I)